MHQEKHCQKQQVQNDENRLLPLERQKIQDGRRRGALSMFRHQCPQAHCTPQFPLAERYYRLAGCPGWPRDHKCP